MEMNFAKQSIESFVQDLNSTKPMPGGGSAAAICGAMGAALAGMSAHMTAGKKKYAAVEEKMQEIITATKILQEEMLVMAQEDADMYSLVLQAFKMPNTTEAEKQHRQAAIEEASKSKQEPGDRLRLSPKYLLPILKRRHESVEPVKEPDMDWQQSFPTQEEQEARMRRAVALDDLLAEIAAKEEQDGQSG